MRDVTRDEAPVLVTGGSGFVACHLIQRLLERGYRVRATVRRVDDTAKVAPLRALRDEHPGRIELFEADLLVDGSFDAGMKGCEVVFHVASPLFMPEKIKDGQRDLDRVLPFRRHQRYVNSVLFLPDGRRPAAGAVGDHGAHVPSQAPREPVHPARLPAGPAAPHGRPQPRPGGGGPS